MSRHPLGGSMLFRRSTYALFSASVMAGIRLRQSAIARLLAERSEIWMTSATT
jgi:hypothetical protein